MQRRTSLSQYGITWTFDKEYPCGHFANGDWWVVGPVVVSEISPGRSDGRNGSMANPTPAHEQGYDSRAWNYNPSLSVQTPFEMDVNVSLVSTISNTDTGSRKLIELKTAAVLTCLAEVPAAGTFRPPFCGTNKPLHNVRQLKRELLPSLAPVAGAPTLAEAERWFQRPWLSHLNHYKSQDIHPADNMPNYGREVAKQTGDVALLLTLDLPEKETLLIRFVQYGIDNYGIFNSDGFWPHNGGHQMGRKWPILFAGMMLNDEAMSRFFVRWPEQAASQWAASAIGEARRNRDLHNANGTDPTPSPGRHLTDHGREADGRRSLAGDDERCPIDARAVCGQADRSSVRRVPGHGRTLCVLQVSTIGGAKGSECDQRDTHRRPGVQGDLS